MDTVFKDLRYALRRLRQAPGFTAIAISVMALGIGANTAIFSVVNAVLFRPPPFESVGELVEVYTNDGEVPVTSSYPDYLDIAEETGLFQEVVTHEVTIFTYEQETGSVPIFGEFVSRNYFSALGIRPYRGRTFGVAEAGASDTPLVAVISYAMWKREFGEDPSVIGRDIGLNGKRVTIIGIGPKEYTGSFPALSVDAWVSMAASIVISPDRREGMERRGRRSLWIKGRLQPGITPERAQAGLDVLHRRLADEYPETNADRPFTVVPTKNVHLHPVIDRALYPIAALLMAAVGLVLVIASTNLANLLLVRAVSRQREVAIRLAIGANRARLLRQLLTESTVLAVVGGGVGVLLAHWGTRLLVSFQPPLPVPIALNIGLDARVLIFAFGLSVATGLLFGLAPAIRASRPDLVPLLKNETRTIRAGRRRFGLHNTLVVSQVAVSLLLLITAGLFVRSLIRSQEIDPGFEQTDAAIATVMFAMPDFDIAPDEAVFVYADRLTDRLAALPGVQGVALADRIPLGAGVQTQDVYIEGYELPPDTDELQLDYAVISPGYFSIMEIPLVRGRSFTNDDDPDAARAVIVSEAMAARFWPGKDAIGQRIRIGREDADPTTIVGVARDTKVRTLSEAPRPYFYVSYRQSTSGLVSFILKTEGAPDVLLDRIRRELRAFDADLPIFELKSMEEHLALMLFPPRMAAALLGGFGALALILSMLGLYGVVAFAVAQRTREMGIRIALGAPPGQVMRTVLVQGFGMVSIGVVIGLALAAVATRPLASFLYGVNATDPATFGGVALLLLLVAVAASYLPARRATRVDPMMALRSE